jgi:hypothetical protein
MGGACDVAVQGASLGAVYFSVISESLIGPYGWRVTFRILAAVTFVGMAGSALVLKVGTEAANVGKVCVGEGM